LLEVSFEARWEAKRERDVMGKENREEIGEKVR